MKALIILFAVCGVVVTHTTSRAVEFTARRAATPGPYVASIQSVGTIFPYESYGTIKVEIRNLGNSSVKLWHRADRETCGSPWPTPRSDPYYPNFTPQNGVVQATFRLSPPREASGKRCRIDILMRRLTAKRTWGAETVLQGKEIPIGVSTYHVIDNTWSLLGYLAPAWRQVAGLCSGKSVGVAGAVDVGMQRYNNDLSFHIRGGPTGTDCEYEIRRKNLKSRWRITEVSWQTIRLKGQTDKCKIGGGAYDSRWQGTNLNLWYFPFIKEGLHCDPSGANPLENNNHGVRKVLTRVKLFGPSNESWARAF